MRPCNFWAQWTPDIVIVPLIAFRLARPWQLIDINAIAALGVLASDVDALSIGACVRHAAFHRPVVAGQELYVDGVSVPRRNGNDQGMILAVQRLGGPAINRLEVVVHNTKTIAEATGEGQ